MNNLLNYIPINCPSTVLKTAELEKLGLVQIAKSTLDFSFDFLEQTQGLLCLSLRFVSTLAPMLSFLIYAKVVIHLLGVWLTDTLGPLSELPEQLL